MFVTHTLAARLEAAQAWRATHYAQAALARRPAVDGAVVSHGSAQVVYGGPGVPVNRVIGLGLDGAVSAADLEAAEEFFRVRHAPVRVDLCPLADPTLIDLLRVRRYVIERHFTVLCRTLTAPPAPTDPALHVARAEPADADRWIHTVARGFDATDAPSEQTLVIIAPNFHSANAHCYWAMVDGLPVGGGGMYDHAGVVELGSTSTLTAFRRHGVQSALVMRRLADAAQLGCDLAMTLTTPGTSSQRNMQRLGFVVAYTKTTVARSVE